MMLSQYPTNTLKRDCSAETRCAAKGRVTKSILEKTFSLETHSVWFRELFRLQKVKLSGVTKLHCV